MDSAHVGDIVGALGTIEQHASGQGRSWWQRMRMLLIIMGPGLIVMVGDNDAGAVATYSQAGQNYGMALAWTLAWTLALLIPVLYVNQRCCFWRTRQSARSPAVPLVPQFPGGLNSTLLLLIVAIVGTTVAPWQLFFQQSNVVDKRITPRWIGYARTDLCIGIAVVMFGGVTLMAAATFAFAGTGDFGNFTDSGAVATGLSDRVGHTVGALFALLLLNASLVGANAVGLATTYTLGDTFNRRHSLHWKITQAPLFYAAYAVVLTVSAAVALSPDAVLGLLTLGVQALAGVLLPSASVFLVLLCNDEPVLGPWVNTVRQNVVAGSIVWILVLLSLALTAATFFPDLATSTYIVGFAVGAGIGIVGGALIALSRRRDDRLEESATGSLTRSERKALTAQDRAPWRTPALATLERPVMSPLRKAGLVTLRGYLIVAAVMVIVKIVQTATGR